MAATVVTAIINPIVGAAIGTAQSIPTTLSWLAARRTERGHNGVPANLLRRLLTASVAVGVLVLGVVAGLDTLGGRTPPPVVVESVIDTPTSTISRVRKIDVAVGYGPSNLTVRDVATDVREFAGMQAPPALDFFVVSVWATNEWGNGAPRVQPDDWKVCLGDDGYWATKWEEGEDLFAGLGPYQHGEGRVGFLVPRGTVPQELRLTDEVVVPLLPTPRGTTSTTTPLACIPAPK